MLVRNRDLNLCVLAERDLGIAILAVLRGPGHHIPHPGGQECTPLSVSVFGKRRIELSIVVDLEINQGAVNRGTILINYSEINTVGLGVIVNQIDFREVRPDHNLLFRAVIVSENPCVHQQSTAGRRIEPPQIKDRLRLTGTKEVPITVSPSLNPGVVVIRVRPTRGVNLTGRDSHSPKSRHSECGLLTATPQRTSHRGKRGQGTSVGWLVGQFLVTPMIHFQNGILHIHTLHTWLQLTVEGDP